MSAASHEQSWAGGSAANVQFSLVCSNIVRGSVAAARLVGVSGAVPGGARLGAWPGDRELVAVRLPGRDNASGPRPPGRAMRRARLQVGPVPAAARLAARPPATARLRAC